MGDVKGISLPAVINEVISVTGVYSFPFTLTPSTSPIDTPTGVIPQPAGPGLALRPQPHHRRHRQLGRHRRNRRHRRRRHRRDHDHDGLNANANLLAAADFRIWVDRIPGAVNRNVTTDFAAPAFNVPTFSRTFGSAASERRTGGTGGTGSGGTGGTGSTGTGTGSTTTGGLRLQPADLQRGRDLDVLGHRDRFVRVGLLGPQLLDRPGPVQRLHGRRLPQHAGRDQLP